MLRSNSTKFQIFKVKAINLLINATPMALQLLFAFNGWWGATLLFAVIFGFLLMSFASKLLLSGRYGSNAADNFILYCFSIIFIFVIERIIYFIF